MNKINYILIMVATITLSACGASIPSKMTNTSPEAKITHIKNFKIIPATLSITSDNPDLVSDVTISLKQHNIFSKIVNNKGKLELFVTHKTKSDHHFGEGMGNAVLEGLTLGLSGDSPDQFDYSVIVDADLKYKNKVISSYRSQGSFTSIVSSSAAPIEKIERTQEVVLKSFKHALDLLAIKIKEDRKKIMKFIM